MNAIAWEDFTRIELRVGTVVAVEEFPEARKPAFKLRVDFGAEVGVKASSAQLTRVYSREELLGRQVLAVVNLPRKQVANFFSEALICGFVGPSGDVVLAVPERMVPDGTRLS